MKKGDTCRVRALGGEWVTARVMLASEGDNSLALRLDRPSISPFKAGIVLDRRDGSVVVPLIRESGGYREIFSGVAYEIEGAT